MSKALEIVKNKLVFLEDELQHYTMVEKDIAKAYLIQCDINDLELVEKELKEHEALKEELDFLKEHNLENEFWLKKLYEENQILKEGIKEIFNPCNLGEPIIEDNEAHKIYIEDSLSMDFEDNDFGGVEYPYLSDGEDKIKKMLEVIENGN